MCSQNTGGILFLSQLQKIGDLDSEEIARD